jgi:hypothetical protein
VKALLMVALAIILLSACGGAGEDCRPDFVGPPSPGFQHLPVCDDTASVRLVDRRTQPEVPL